MVHEREAGFEADLAAELKARLDEAMALAVAGGFTHAAACIAHALDALPCPNHLV